MTALDLGDIQGIVFSGYAEKPSACFVFLKVDDAERAKAWLGALVRRVTTGARRPAETNLNVAFTATGLAALGIGTALSTFPIEFVEGVAGSEKRSEVLGDVDGSHPSHWVWGGPSVPVDVILMLYATEGHVLDDLLSNERAAFTPALREVYLRSTVWLPDRREHFGFADGIAQPRIKELGSTPAPGQAQIRAGEFILGYPNEYDKLPASPEVPAGRDRGGLLSSLGDSRRDFGANGAYLVVRQLDQNVSEFWSYMKRQADGDANEAVRLAAKCVGRWPSGAPLVRAPDRDDPTLSKANDFLYREEDPHGLRCPIGAHIRRTNPRDSLDPGPTESLRVADRHSLIRRGRSYGPPLERFATEDTPKERGLLFVCVNANVARQFEFVQQTWVNNPKFDGLYDDGDPLIGSPGSEGGSLSIPERPFRRRLMGIPRFTTVKGAGYFFLPGLRALRVLAGEGDAPLS
jgi:Dyp-type peroxidase family